MSGVESAIGTTAAAAAAAAAATVTPAAATNAVTNAANTVTSTVTSTTSTVTSTTTTAAVDSAATFFGNVSEGAANFARVATSAVLVASATGIHTALGRPDQITWHRPDNQGGNP